MRFKCVFKKTLNNYFLTLVNEKGNVIIIVSLGDININNKKKKRSPIVFRDLVSLFVQKLVDKKITKIETIIFLSKFR